MPGIDVSWLCYAHWYRAPDMPIYRYQFLYRIRNGLVAIPAAAATLNHFPPAPPALFETRYVQIQCNTGTYSRTFFPSAIWLWNTPPVDICQLSADSFKTHLNSFRFIWAPDYVLFLSSALHCFYPKLLCIGLLHGFLDTHLLTHSWCDIARNRVGTVIGRWRWKC